jgi:hypothetical protein
VQSFTADKTFPAVYNTPITFTAAATGGNVEYQFWRYSSATGWAMARDYSATNSFTWFPPLGANAVQVWVRTVGSSASYQDYRSSGVFDVVSAPSPSSARLTSLVANSTFPVSPQAQVTWTASGTGGSGTLEYKFFLYNVTTRVWSVFRDWSTNPVAAQPVAGVAGTGRYVVQVWVRSVGSGVHYEDWRSSNEFTVTDIRAVALSPSINLSPAPSGSVISFTTSVSGGSGPWDFAFMVYDGSSWTVRQPYTANANTLSIVFAPGTYVIQVWVRSSGSATAWEAWQTTGMFTVQ